MRRVVLPGHHADVLFGEAPYGWRLSRQRSSLVRDADEQRVIAVVHHMYFVERLPMRDIVSRLAEMGVASRRGKPFGLSSVFSLVHHDKKPPPEAATSGRPAAGKRPRGRRSEARGA